MLVTVQQAQALVDTLERNAVEQAELSGGQRGSSPGAESESIRFTVRGMDFRIAPTGTVHVRDPERRFEPEVNDGADEARRENP